MDAFCNSTFWDLNVTWYTDDPDFTPCFQQTVLVWVPCVFLWLFTPLEIYFMKSSKNRNVPSGFCYSCKLTLTLALIVLSLVDLTMAIDRSDRNTVYPVSYCTPIIKMITFILSAVLLEANRKYGLRTSGLQFLFWFLLLIFGIPELRAQTRGRHILVVHHNAAERYSITSYLICYVFSLAIFIFNCCGDDEPRQTKYPKSDKPYPELGASYLSRLFYAWFEPLVWKGSSKPLEQNDLWDINPEDSSKELIPVYLKYWNRPAAKAPGYNRLSDTPEQEKKKTASIFTPICKAFGSAYLFAAILMLIPDVLIFVSPQLLRALINFVNAAAVKAPDSTANGNEPAQNIKQNPLWHGIFYAVLLFVVATLQTLLSSQCSQRIAMVGLRIRTTLVSTVYRKALRLSNTARKESTVGEVVNLMAVDAQHLMDLSSYIHEIWSCPLKIALALYFLYDLLGYSAFAGLAVMIILIPLNGFFGNKVLNLQIRQMKNKDERVKMMNEILSGMKVIKLYAWEPSFEDQVQNIRGKEIKVMTESAYMFAGAAVIWTSAPLLVSLVSFICFILSDEKNILDATKAFVSISLFDILRAPLSSLPIIISILVQASVSVTRINKFMNSEELDPQNVSHDPSDETPFSIEGGTFSWGNDEPSLKNIDLQVNKGHLVAVVGTVGSGKSSIISAILGEMDRLSGRVNTTGTIAYVSQQAWIQNATLQDNILFGKPMDRKRYNQVIAVCALKPDLEMLPGGDATEIGEKGINLSGGQKQRVSLARAVYNDADIYLLDDPLSAVDAHVGKHIFENVIGPTGVLATKSRLLVTHGITYLPNVDNIYVVKEGEISESGTMKELMTKKGDFAEFLIQHLEEEEEENLNEEVENLIEFEEDLDEIYHQIELTTGSVSVAELRRKFERVLSRSHNRSINNQSPSGGSRNEIHLETVPLNENLSTENTISNEDSEHSLDNYVNDDDRQKLIEDEDAGMGSVKWDVYKHYAKSIGIWLAILTIILNIAHQGLVVGSNMWLAKWSNDIAASNDTYERNVYLGGYAGFGFGQVLLSFCTWLIVTLGFINSAKVMQESLLKNVLRWPMELFDTTPVGRVLNRFSKDVEMVDNVLPNLIRSWIVMFFMVLATLVVITISTYIFLAVILPLGIVYYFVQRFYVATSCRLRRLESVSRSPIYSHFGESIQGASIIRAYNVQERFIKCSDDRVDFNQKCYIPSVFATRWLSVRLEMIGNLIILFAALFAVLSRDTLDPGTVGLSVSYALQITQSLNFLVLMTSEVETNIVAVERIKEYIVV
ncbi:multidrug resistance-associated protein 1-like [Sitodiplosis mosellana]|uniref:multidrug resistance-associated protein 1-like n=1 Tax=Sitodiplosis mosellana TaxID=263140 RepID=UPI002443B535|nr:multidrug resistance-associated protein 1-like [Sitodiplosis mosellana]